VEDIIHVLIIFCLECLESDRVLLFSERHTLLRVLPVLVVLATSGEREGESIFKKIKIPRLMSIFKKDPVVPAFPDLHLAPASILKELAPYFHRLSAQMRLIGLPLPHELNGKEAAEYPPYNVAIGLHGALEIHRIVECHG
jgi:cytoplasmic FMR1 interacting protein